MLIFKSKKNPINVKKTFVIFEYFLELSNKCVKEEIKNYQEESEDEMDDLNEDIRNDLEDKKKKLDEYYTKEALITKKDFAFAIQMFMALVLFREKDKSNKIKMNTHNIVNYLQAPDFWKNQIYKKEKFKKGLYELRIINIQINQIVWLFNYLIGPERGNKDKENKNKKKEKDVKDKKQYLEKEESNEANNNAIKLKIKTDKNYINDENDE